MENSFYDKENKKYTYEEAVNKITSKDKDFYDLKEEFLAKEQLDRFDFNNEKELNDTVVEYYIKRVS